MNEREALAGAAAMAALGGAVFTGRWDPVWVVAGAALIGVGAGLVATRVTKWAGAGLAAAGLGGWLLTDRALADGRASWMTVVGVVVGIVLALGVGSISATGTRAPIVYWAVMITAGGIWACVPETDAAGRGMAVVVVACAAAIVLERPVTPSLLGTAAGLMLFTGLQGGQYRASAVIGMAGSFGLFLVIGLVAGRLRAVDRRDVALLAAHLGAVALASRVAGRGSGLARPVLIETIVLVGLVGATLLVSRTSKERTA